MSSISSAAATDALLVREQSWGRHARPEDYLDSFGHFVREQLNQSIALSVVVNRPKDLTREQLKEVRMLLDGSIPSSAGMPELREVLLRNVPPPPLLANKSFSYLSLGWLLTGAGIAPDRLPQLFQPFAQGDTATARVHGGTGLGLMICKHLVALMGGEIGVQSTPGAGSCFRFTIRSEVADLAQVPVPRHTPLPHAARAERVLVVDDHPVNLKVAAAMLARLGYPHHSVSDGAAALQALTSAQAAQQPFALVLLDSHMPGMDGQATAQAIVVAREIGHSAIRKIW